MHLRRKLSLALLLLLSACNDSPIHQAAKSLRDAAKAIEAVQGTVIDLNARGMMPTASTRSILETTQKLNAAGLQAASLLRVMEKTGNKNPDDVLKVLDSLIKDVALFASQLRISDEKVRLKIATSIQLAQASLNAARLVLVTSSVSVRGSVEPVTYLRITESGVLP